ncbi:type IV pilin N-terminal domain-containing protein [Halobacteria archaeon HArc-gm2]|nr:type IV pilin N-terminal domain-containing protein [Halobacteria archaeon HArc-gm2]
MVGLILLIILAAVLGSFVLGMGESSAAATPQASFTVDYDAAGETAEITHDGGDAIPADELSVETGDRTVAWDDGDGEVTAGDSTAVDAAPGTTVSVVWSAHGESAVLMRATVE